MQAAVQWMFSGYAYRIMDLERMAKMVYCIHGYDRIYIRHNYVISILGGDAIERACELARTCEPARERERERERRRQERRRERRLSSQSFSSSKIHFLATSALSSADDARMSSCPCLMRDATI